MSVLNKWNKKCRNVGLPTGNQKTQHRFADDQVIIAQDEDNEDQTTKMQ